MCGFTTINLHISYLSNKFEQALKTFVFAMVATKYHTNVQNIVSRNRKYLSALLSEQYFQTDSS